MTFAFAHRSDTTGPRWTLTSPVSAGAGDGRTRLGLLAGIAALLTVAVFTAPPLLAGATAAQRDLPAASRDAFASFWAGSTPPLDDLAAYWSRFHAAKAVLAALLLIVAVQLSRTLARRFSARSGRLRFVDAAASASIIGSTLLTGLAAVILLANLQGTMVPRSSLLSAVPAGSPHPADVSALVDDFGRYHLVMAVLAGVATLVLAVLAVRAWRSRHHASMRAAIVSRAYVATLLMCALVAAVVTAANVSTTLDPAFALEAVFTSV
ncbi:hypothetical protein [Gordonia malaquae]|uniref:hypothetical protein n=1 Tax=Gordonia malaquae TaxID=410332 RepID=UPI0030FED17F